MDAGQTSGNERQYGSSHHLPPENGAYRLAQVAKHVFGILRDGQNKISIALERGTGQFAAPR
jgi:hypothetical protein